LPDPIVTNRQRTTRRRRSELPRGPRRASPWRRCGAVVTAVVVLAAGLVLSATAAGAHTPHDTVTGIAAAPDYRRSATTYVVAASRLFACTQGGCSPRVRGLPRAPEVGESIAKVAVAPSAPDVVYVSSRSGGVFKSTDRAASFTSVTDATGPQDVIPIAVSPRSPDVVLTAGAVGGLFRTADGGAHWSRVPTFQYVPVVTFVPGTGRAVAGVSPGRIWISDDGGATWRLAHAGQGASITALAASAGSPATVFAGDAKGRLLRSGDGGTSFAPVPGRLPVDQVNGIALSPRYGSDRTLWVSLAEHGVYRSTDAVHVSEFRDIVAAAGAHGTELLEAAFDGFFRSNDGGRTWAEQQTLADFVVGLGVSPDFANDRTIAAATYVKGAYLSTDAGTDWTMIDRGLGQRPGSGNKFAPIRRLHNMTFSPDYARDHTLFSAGWTAFLRSTDRGGSWQAVRVDPEADSSLLRQYVLGVAPDYPRRHELYLGTRQGDVYRSERAGVPGSWSHVGATGVRVRTLVFDPDAASGTVFAGTAAGVMKSTDRGSTWTRTGPDGETMLAISPEFDTDGTLFAASPDRGLFVTRDGTASWSPVTLPGSRGVEAVAVSPAFGTDHTVLVSLVGGPLLRSTDGGRTFAPTGSNLNAGGYVIADFTNPSGSPIQFSPTYAKDRTVFAYGSRNVLRSTDRGSSWTVLTLPSAATFLRRYQPSGDDTGAVASSGHGISKRKVAAVVAIVLVVLALAASAIWLFRRRRRTNAPGT